MKDTFISPISIDLGAKKTGVYFAHYPAGSTLDVFENEEGVKAGKVYSLDRNSYTLLMTERTAARHQRRGYDRRQMAKRLFKLIWCEHFKLPWDKDVQQTVSFLMNRRGFSFLTEEYNVEALGSFPQKAFEELPEELKKDVEQSGDSYNFADCLVEWSRDKDAVKEKFDAINKEPKRIKNQLFVSGRIRKLKEYCDKRSQGEKIKEGKKGSGIKLAKLPKWVIEKYEEADIKGLPEVEENTFDMVEFLNEKVTPEQLQMISGSIPTNTTQKEQELKKSDWDFQSNSIDLEKVDFGTSSNPNIKAHLHHLAFALHKVWAELESGGRHRSKYFDEVRNVLENKNHRHGYLKRFCKELQSDGFKGLKVDKLVCLIGHISNLELKPLRKYFNNPKHKKSDYWKEARLEKVIANWMLKEWRVNPQKDKLKAQGKDYDYGKLKSNWKKKSGTVIDFWTKNNPNWTVPPYQDNNNRRPPRCQSLVFNAGYLNGHYLEWQKWVRELKDLKEIKSYLDTYEKELKELKSGVGSPYFTDKRTGKLIKDSGRRSLEDLDARILQFIFDRVKSEDSLKLNEIYSHAKKYRQQQSTHEEKEKAKEKLEETIEDSNLPADLKTQRDYKSESVFKDGTFLHLVCKYYKQRQRARDGRIFIHPEYRFVKISAGYENTGRFDDKSHLLTYCNHKPRQKRYQMLGDIAGVLQVSPKDLKSFIEEKQKENGKATEEKLFEWLNSIKGLEANCGTAAKEQKERRGRLKLDIQKVFRLISYRKENPKPSGGEIKKILEKSGVKDAHKLYSFCTRAIDLCLKLAKPPLYEEARHKEWKKELEANPATPVYLLAQINNIAFKERSGNANTCAVCSMDNAQRMQIAGKSNGRDSVAKAQRLPAIPTRIIDGAVKRLARIVGGAIAKDKWEKIEKPLTEGHKVCVPIITESNRFEFEPDLKTLKGKQSEGDGKNDPLKDKDDRIREDGRGICPYTGTPVSSEGGDKDHIIPRSSKWGVLNDEANLIWASDRGNKEVKKDKEFSLNDLHREYKEKQFDTDDDEEIENWIVEQIGDGEGDSFKFGQYRSFINLTPEQQKAFRHALFLTGRPLREKVIAAIDNRNRALVNGTQRYLAQSLADNLHRKAKRIGKAGLLSFDYFGVEAWDTTRGNGVKDLREELVEQYRSDLKKFDKKDDSSQEAYSHLLDAQIAFCMALHEHQKEGSFKMNFNGLGLWSKSDRKTGEIYGSALFDKIQVSSEEFELDEKRELKRRTPYDVETHYRQQVRDNSKVEGKVSYQIHRSTSIAERFMPLIQLENGSLRKGFSIENSVEYKKGDCEKIKPFLRYHNKNNMWLVKKKEALTYLMDIGRNGSVDKGEAKLLDGLAYQTVKKEVKKVLQQGKDSPETVSEALGNWDECIKEKDFRKDGVLLPVFFEWERLKSEMEKTNNSDQELQSFLKNSKVFRDKHERGNDKHNKSRKVYSLPVVSNIGNIRLKRESWDRREIIQTVAEESFAKYGLDSKKRPHTVLSNNSIPVKHYSGLPESLLPEPREWKEIPDNFLAEYNEGVSIPIVAGQIIYKDASRCTARLKVRCIENLSLPQDKRNWKGKLFRYEKEEEWKEKKEKEKSDNRHYPLSEWKWFVGPFKLPKGRNEVIMREIDGIYEIEFTIQKSRDIQGLLGISVK